MGDSIYIVGRENRKAEAAKPRAKRAWAEPGEEVLNERSEFRNLTPILSLPAVKRGQEKL